MNDFITEAWLRANHTLSEGGEIHLPADARLTPAEIKALTDWAASVQDNLPTK